MSGKCGRRWRREATDDVPVLKVPELSSAADRVLQSHRVVRARLAAKDAAELVVALAEEFRAASDAAALVLKGALQVRMAHGTDEELAELAEAMRGAERSSATSTADLLAAAHLPIPPGDEGLQVVADAARRLRQAHETTTAALGNVGGARAQTLLTALQDEAVATTMMLGLCRQ